MSELTGKTCTPCRGGVPPLSPQEAERYLADVPDWSLSDSATRVKRTFKLKDFVSAMDFARRVGELAEQEGHHPDVTFGWGYCRVEFQTHKIKGLHENDFIMAAKVDELARRIVS
jgi:4a-hydroxytetrahydrobiopterin dehydratase